MTTAEIVKSVVSKNKDEKDDSGVSSSTLARIICCLDLLNTNFDGLPADAAHYAAKFHLLPTLHAVLSQKCFEQRVRSFYRATHNAVRNSTIYMVGQKTGRRTHDHNSVISLPIYKFCSLEDSLVNLQLNGY